MKAALVIAVSVFIWPLSLMAQQATVRVVPADLHGPRPLAQETADSVIRDYLQSWKAMSTALEQNRAGALSPDFVGTALDKLTHTVHEQASRGIHTRYKDKSHNLQIVFYSPEGLSVELVDKAEYEEQVFDHDKLLASQPVQATYVVVLTPSEVRWRVRVMQASLE